MQLILHHVYCWFGLKDCTSSDKPLDPEMAASILAKNKKNKQVNLNHRLLKDVRFVVFDTETTGLKVREDDIISIAGVVVENGQVLSHQVFDRLVNPMRPIPGTITELTGISEDMVRTQPTIYPVLLDFLDFIEGSVLVAHRVGFDVEFLNKYLKYAKTKVYNPTVDTITLSQVVEPCRSCHSLDELVCTYEVPLHPRHTALGDALMTAHLFGTMLEELQSRRMLATLGEFRQILWQQHL